MPALSASAPVRGCVKTPESRIAFPLEARIARLQCTLAPLPSQSAQASRDRSPPARLFTQSGEVLGALGLSRYGWVGDCSYELKEGVSFGRQANHVIIFFQEAVLNKHIKGQRSLLFVLNERCPKS